MRIKESFKNKVAILTLKGDMMGGPDSGKLHDKIKSLAADNITRVVVDLSNIKYMNSSGLGILMASFGTITKINGMIKLAGNTEKVKSLLIITQLIQFFDDYKNVDHAVAAFLTEAG